jgi:Protein of unknown function (DUF4236)
VSPRRSAGPPLPLFGVKPVNPDDPAAADVIADWKKTPGTVGIRIIMTKESKRAPDDPGFDRILRAAVRNDFPVNILFWGNIDAGLWRHGHPNSNRSFLGGFWGGGRQSPRHPFVTVGGRYLRTCGPRARADQKPPFLRHKSSLQLPLGSVARNGRGGMGFRFRRSTRFAPELRLNVGLKSVSVSTGIRGLSHTMGALGQRVTVGLPGTGLFWTKAWRNGSTRARGSCPYLAAAGILILFGLAIGAMLVGH